MLVDVVFPFDSLGCQDWSHEIIDSGYKPQAHLRRGEPTSSMVDDEEHGVGWRFPSAIEAAKSVFVEEDIDKECRNVPFDVDIGDAPSKNVLFAGGQSVRREFESPPRHFDGVTKDIVGFGDTFLLPYWFLLYTKTNPSSEPE